MAVVALLAVLYLAMGVAVYLNDVARGWCELDLSFGYLFWWAFFWPLRLLYGDVICGIDH